MKVKALDIAQMASASDVIFGALKDAIIDGSLAEGEVLRQDRIATMFNVSRIPVREALARLESEGLVTTQRYRGAVVSSLSVDEISEIFEFRALIEPEVIRRAASRWNETAEQDARRHGAAFATETDPARWGDLNRSFHAALYRDAGQPYHLQVVDSAMDRVDRYLRAQLALTGGMERARSEHEQLLEAWLARDAERAAALLRDHILGAGQALVAFLERSARSG